MGVKTLKANLCSKRLNYGGAGQMPCALVNNENTHNKTKKRTWQYSGGLTIPVEAHHPQEDVAVHEAQDEYDEHCAEATETRPRSSTAMQNIRSACRAPKRLKPLRDIIKRLLRV